MQLLNKHNKDYSLGAANKWNKLQMRLQANLSAIFHYSNLTGNRDAERKQTTTTKKSYYLPNILFLGVFF